MVIVLDLDEEAIEPPIAGLSLHHRHLSDHKHLQQLDTFASHSLDFDVARAQQVQPAPDANADIFATALSCYPIVSAIASLLDLNTLHSLASTCTAIRSVLIANRHQLVKQTLRCVHDEQSPEAMADHAAEDRDLPRRRLVSGRVALCARDMVGECRRCGITVCRNCTIKPLPQSATRERHRRLCKVCQKAPLRQHTHESEVIQHNGELSFTSPAFSKGSCCCPEMVFLCLSCGSALRSKDTTYMRGWTWRTRYSTYLGGLGTGIGEGNEGVECGKGASCLAAKEIEKEIDCDADKLAELKRDCEKVERQGRHWGGTSYMTQEIEGIGGIVKKKVKKRIKVGAVVKEYEDERETGKYLNREQTGANRSWCYWCCRIVPSDKDTRPSFLRRSTGASISSSSTSSTVGA